MDDDLYQQAILTLAKSAAADDRLPEADASVTIDNPLCGDRVTIDVVLSDGRVESIGGRVRGCKLCQAATATITRRAPGQQVSDLNGLHARVARMLEEAAPPVWDELAAFDPVRAYPSRHECVLLPFEALEQVLAEATRPAPE